jgi:hypothetical protein
VNISKIPQGQEDGTGQRVQSTLYTLANSLCFRRASQPFAPNKSFFFAAVIGNFVLALIISSFFYNLKATMLSFYSRGDLLFFAILMNVFASSLEIPQIYEQRPIVEKHWRMAVASSV